MREEEEEVATQAPNKMRMPISLKLGSWTGHGKLNKMRASDVSPPRMEEQRQEEEGERREKAEDQPREGAKVQSSPVQV